MQSVVGVLALCLIAIAGCANHPDPVRSPTPPPVATVVVEQAPASMPVTVEPTRPPEDSTPIATGDESVEITAPRHRSKLLDGPARPAKIAPGAYVCRVDAMYKLRPCSVTRDERGFLWLSTPGSLLDLKGILYDEGGAIVFEGTTDERRPFGCFSCDERCTRDPKSCVCEELMTDASKECLAQPLKVRFTRKGAGWSGTLAYKTYFNHYEGNGPDRHVTGWDPSPNTFVVEIMPAPGGTKAPPVAPKASAPTTTPRTVP